MIAIIIYFVLVFRHSSRCAHPVSFCFRAGRVSPPESPFGSPPKRSAGNGRAKNGKERRESQKRGRKPKVAFVMLAVQHEVYVAFGVRARLHRFLRFLFFSFLHTLELLAYRLMVELCFTDDFLVPQVDRENEGSCISGRKRHTHAKRRRNLRACETNKK